MCNGCIYAHEAAAAASEKDKCPFCRSLAHESDEEGIQRLKRRIKVNEDAEAMCLLGGYFQTGENWLPQDSSKAMELLHKAVKLGNHDAHYNLGVAYYKGDIVGKDTKKARYHYHVAAMGGFASARQNIGVEEMNKGNMERAYKHLMISANAGYDLSMKTVQDGYKHGFVTKDDFAKTIRAYGSSVDETKSEQRNRALVHGNIG